MVSRGSDQGRYFTQHLPGQDGTSAEPRPRQVKHDRRIALPAHYTRQASVCVCDCDSLCLLNIKRQIELVNLKSDQSADVGNERSHLQHRYEMGFI